MPEPAPAPQDRPTPPTEAQPVTGGDSGPGSPTQEARPPQAATPLPARPGGPRTRFTVLSAHAQGGLGRVSVAREEKLHRLIALEEIRPDRARFLREAEITGQLEHPGIVPVYALEEDEEGRPSYAMRFISAPANRDLLRESRDLDPLRRREDFRRLLEELK
jgi:serine/threonine protein kinase